MEPKTCPICGRLVKSKEGHKPRKFCNNPNCRKQGSRKHIAEEKQRERDAQIAMLRNRWSHLTPIARDYLEKLLKDYGLEAAILGTNAVETQSKTV